MQRQQRTITLEIFPQNFFGGENCKIRQNSKRGNQKLELNNNNRYTKDARGGITEDELKYFR